MDGEFQFPEFVPPHGMEASFGALSRNIGAAAFKSWFRGCEAYRRPDGSILIKASTALRAKWIRANYAMKLEFIEKQPVLVEFDDKEAPRSWPDGGPKTTADAWWQKNDRWARDDGKGGGSSSGTWRQVV